MALPIIRIQGVSKKYNVPSSGQSQRYSSLRDKITENLKNGIKGFSKKSQDQQKKIEEFWALRDISFDVQSGERVGLIGKNGSGKSTLLKIVSSITEPTKGRVELRGRVATLLEVGTGFHPELSGRENIFLNGAILGMTRKEVLQKFDEIVAFSEISQFLDLPVKRYSSGMYVRLAFAIAAHLEPDILIADEVLAVGDMEFQKKCLGKMREVSVQDGRTVLFVSHSMSAISNICSRAILLKSGQILKDGAVNDVIPHYLSSEAESTQWIGNVGDDVFRLHKTSLTNTNPQEQLQTDSTIEITIEGILLKTTSSLIIGFRLYSGNGDALVYMLSDDLENDASPVLSPRKIIRKFIIPSNTLASGNYRIGFDIGLHNIKRIIDERTGSLSFHLENISGIGRRYALDAPGYSSILRPNWERINLDEPID